ncbi:MAG TPA: hypothetical protein VF933_27920, partial [Streptosporangiaceae bacterium]
LIQEPSRVYAHRHAQNMTSATRDPALAPPRGICPGHTVSHLKSVVLGSYPLAIVSITHRSIPFQKSPPSHHHCNATVCGFQSSAHAEKIGSSRGNASIVQVVRGYEAEYGSARAVIVKTGRENKPGTDHLHFAASLKQPTL